LTETHSFDVAREVQIVGVKIFEVELIRQASSDSAFSSTRYTDHGDSSC
jgi:hypothetical protein